MYLSFSIDAYDATCWLMRSSNKDRVGTYSIHIDTNASLDVIQVNVTVFGYQIYDVIFFRNLHGNRKVILSLRRKEYIHCLFGVRLVASSWLAYFNNVELKIKLTSIRTSKYFH